MTASASVEAFPWRGWSDATGHIDRLLEANSGLVGVAIVDIDHYEAARDQVEANGATEQQLLSTLAARLAASTNPGDFTARLGDDDYLIVRGPLAAPAAIESVGLNLVSAMNKPLTVGPVDLVCQVSVGVATSGEGDSARRLLRFAQYALDDAKALGRNRMVAFDDLDRDLLADLDC